MRDMALPVENEDILKCMINSTILPRGNDEAEIDLNLKPNFPFDLSTSRLIENYLCRIHNTLKAQKGQELPLLLYTKTLRKIFRDKRRVLPQMFCGQQYHLQNNLECE